MFTTQPLTDVVENETLGSSKTKEEVLTYLSQNNYPIPLFVDHFRDRILELRGRTVKDIDFEYRNTLGYPVPTHQDRITKAIRQLCRDRKISINHQRGNFCGQDPNLTDNELMNATIDAPFNDSVTPPARSTMQITNNTTDGNGGDGGSGDTEPILVIPSLTPTQDLLELAILPQSTPGLLRQAIAEKIQNLSSPVVKQIKFMIVIDQSYGDLSSLTASLRGSLSGQADVYAEINIKQRGEFTKLEVEQMAERLPNISGATYQADLRVKQGGNDAI
jgi:hypothetical protein